MGEVYECCDVQVGGEFSDLQSREEKLESEVEHSVEWSGIALAGCY